MEKETQTTGYACPDLGNYGTGGTIDDEAPEGELRNMLSMIADIIVEDMLRVERELGIRPRDFPAYYEDRRRMNREGGQRK